MAIDSAGQRDSALIDLDEYVRRSQGQRRPFEPHWFLQLSYYLGRQWVAWDGQQLYEPQLQPYQIKLVDNRIQPVVRTEVAKMTKSRPVFVATPHTGDDADVRAARMCERVLEYEWLALDLTRKQRQALLWSRIAGAGFWKVCWNPDKGDSTEVFTGPDGNVLMDHNNRPMHVGRQDVHAVIKGLPQEAQDQIGTKKLSVGDISVEVRTPFEIFPDPLVGEEGLESAQWVVEEVVQSTEYVKNRYGKDVSPDAEAVAGIAESRLPGLGGAVQGEKTGVKVRELWHLPCPEHPNGRHVVWCSSAVLKDEDNPYPWLPYVMFRGIPVPGRFWPTSVTEQLISPQTELNKRKAQIAENAQRVGNPPLAVSRQSNIEWNGLPGEWLRYDDTLPNSLPSFLTVPEMPGYVREDIQRIESSINEISGQHEASNGSVPTGVTAASAINLLQEADDTRLGPDVQDMEKSISEAGSRIAWLVAKLYNDQRTIRISGDDGDWDIFEFRGAMLRGNTNVEVQAGSGMPRSKAAKQAAMQDLLNLVLQYGVQVNQRDLRKFFQDYEVGGLERMFGSLNEDEMQVTRENRQLGQGQPVPVRDFNDHAFHIEAHNDFRNSARYANLPPNVQQVFDQHVAAHQQAQAAAAAAAAPPPPPGAPAGPQQVQAAPQVPQIAAGPTA